MKAKLLFLCTGNSCRSQMAEGLTRADRGDRFEVRSAGVLAQGVDPRAVAVMAEIGIDISGQRSKSVSDVLDQRYDWVVTVCDKAKESCPAFPGTAAFVHQPFDDPPLLAAAETDEEAALEHYRRVRDEIRTFVRRMPDNLDQKTADRAGDTANAIGRLFDR